LREILHASLEIRAIPESIENRESLIPSALSPLIADIRIRDPVRFLVGHHARGRATDINPMQNPYINGAVILPARARDEPRADGTLTADHPVTKAFLARGLEWGGHWKSRKDYQHFEKPPKTTT
jgi:hypothetical protein